ncbi:MAG: DUF6472 family protein [Eubacterium sp.]|uniref:DUF6472 domain-containing protein n=2 Tax=Eubacterium oxidoreducens TaxID=1732 RepID=A0A1G6BQN2_EUBOX|nr:DUF6472 family protein [Eubacterium oxidoreducens]MCR5665571.1 DUF6472 family protein [Eubacterium sp.]SDB22875.1 hypothetical protein SAMN02910417_01687 [Eubacterium oxidoreducens]
MANGYPCESCNNFIYDEDDEEYYCDVSMDEDDLAHFYASKYKECPYYQSDNEYLTVRKQM